MSDANDWQMEFDDPVGQSHIRIAVAEVSQVNGTEIKLSIQVCTSNGFGKDFSAHTHVWLFGGEVEQFVAELQELELTRSGKATLKSVSPDELSLAFEPLDRAGHMAVQATVVAKILSARDQRMENRVTSQIEIDPSRLPEYLSEFQRLAAIFR